MAGELLGAIAFAGAALWLFPWGQPRWSANQKVSARTSKRRFLAMADRRLSFVASAIFAILAVAMLINWKSM